LGEVNERSTASESPPKTRFILNSRIIQLYHQEELWIPRKENVLYPSASILEQVSAYARLVKRIAEAKSLLGSNMFVWIAGGI
jgi:hypothetical protein